MKKFRRFLRVLGLVVFISLASVGMPMTGAAPVLSQNREKYLQRTEQTERKEDEDGTLQQDEKT